MQRRGILWALGLLVGSGQAWMSGQALAAAVEEAFACQNQERERRIELRHAERPDRLPCQVVYWRDGRQPDGGKPIWEAENDYGFCIEQTRALLQRLQDGGWSCRKLPLDGTTVATIPALAPRGEEALAVPAPSPAPATVSDRERLNEALARDLSRLAELSSPGARFEMAAAELGDLDGDGDADAAVLLTYLTAQRQPAQFLMVYRFDGNTFRPAAKTYVGRLEAGGAASAIERIDGGTVELWLELPDSADGVRRQRQTFMLQDDALLRQPPEG
jgi:hypothetical protein